MADKVFKTYTEQRELLESRGLLVPHPRFFTNCMQRDDYYNIINGYKKYFIASMNPEHYIQGTTFEQIYALYSFDQSIRAYFLTDLIKIEKHIKALVAYHFSEVHGYDHRKYLNEKCFKHDDKDGLANLKGYLKKPGQFGCLAGADENILHELSHITRQNKEHIQEKYHLDVAENSDGACVIDVHTQEQMKAFIDTVTLRRGKDFDSNIVTCAAPFKRHH